MCSSDLNAVYRIQDMAACLRRMDETARRHIILVQTIGLPYAPPLKVFMDDGFVERERAYAMADILSELGVAFRFRTYKIDRGFGPINQVALIDWRSAS